MQARHLPLWAIIAVYVVLLAAGARADQPDAAYLLPKTQDEALRYAVSSDRRDVRAPDEEQAAEIEVSISLWSPDGKQVQIKVDDASAVRTIGSKHEPIDFTPAKGEVFKGAMDARGAVTLDVGPQEKPGSPRKMVLAFVKEEVLPILFVPLPEGFDGKEGTGWGTASDTQGFSNHPADTAWTVAQAMAEGERQEVAVIESTVKQSRPDGGDGKPKGGMWVWQRKTVLYDVTARQVLTANSIYRFHSDSTDSGMGRQSSYRDCTVRKIGLAPERPTAPTTRPMP